MNSVYVCPPAKNYYFFIISFLLCVRFIHGCERSDDIFNAQVKILDDLLVNTKPFVSKQLCSFQKKPYGNVLSIEHVNEVEYLNDHQIVIAMDQEKHFLIDLCSCEQWEFSKPFMKVQSSVPTSEKREKRLNWQSDGCAHVRIYNYFADSTEKKYRFDYESVFLPVYVDQNKLPLIWVKKDTYRSNDCYTLSCSRDVNIYKAAFDASLDPDGIISECKKRFTTYSEGKQMVFSCFPSECHIMHFYFLGAHFILQHKPKRPYDLSSSSILYPDKENINKIDTCKDLPLACSIAINPAEKDIFALMLAHRKTIQYWHYQGELLAEQNSSLAHDDEESKLYDKHLSFSPDGRHLAAVFPQELIIFNVPFRAQITPKKFAFIFFCLKNQILLPKDVVGLLFDIFKF